MTVPTEQEMQAAAVAPRVKQVEISKEIATVEYAYVGLMTLCVLTFHNGFKVVGQSACASAANYNKTFGEQFAFRDAKRQIGAYLGFRICEERYKQEQNDNLVASLAGDDDCGDACKI